MFGRRERKGKGRMGRRDRRRRARRRGARDVVWGKGKRGFSFAVFY